MELAYQRFFLAESDPGYSRLLLPSEFYLRSAEIRNATCRTLGCLDGLRLAMLVDRMAAHRKLDRRRLSVLVPFDHVASVIVNADHGIV